MPDGTPQISVLITTDAKPWYLSKTLIVNALVMALATAESQLHILQPLLPVSVWQLVAFFLPVVNAALRVVTTNGIKL
jgi:hypothetical protein